ncbi:PHD and RING finger domain-containing protein [Cyphellophora attinorum]|uniref:PHD and RING finger domain-containing protein n=1 Tax=Cyphellophora attinorum TaxID=1664694 RepID=A0A0N1NZB2_9EURO|nr:PHD and RING finger domain-containing protein [Phialophora attinorum]KPI37083.1 PHD and RING finger domain-containing protein [Phialophora attinorum]
MSDTCIVCLGDLSTGNGDAGALSITNAKSPESPLLHDIPLHATSLDEANTASVTSAINDPTLLIAKIIPCGHVLHNECLTPWRERANSCPICRAAFHLVELKAVMDGPTLSTYKVEDRQQVADIDPTMFLESADDEEEEVVCQECGEGDNEDVLMFCDGCEILCHTYCAGLDEVPYGAWFCETCDQEQGYMPRPTGRRSRGAQAVRQRTRGRQRRQRTLQVGQDQNWNAVWQSVWSRLNLDLDFPFDDDDTSASYIRRCRQRSAAHDRSALAAWQSRLRVAELQGAGNRFREIEPNLIAVSRGSRSTPAPEQDSEEALAWSAFDAARASPGPSTSRRTRKRKSPTASPVQDEPEATQAVPKRRRTSASITPAPPSSRGRVRSSPRSPVANQPTQISAVGPSFLQSLLQEVEDSSTTTATALNPAMRRAMRAAGSPPATDHSSPRPSSPSGSPLPSNHSSPRAMSPSPPPGHRSISPSTLSSSIQPIYAEPERPGSPPPRGRPVATPRPRAARSNSETDVAHPVPRLGVRTTALANSDSDSASTLAPPTRRRPQNHTPIQTSENKKQDVSASAMSPTRATMSLEAKSDIQKLVSSALKPLYNEAKITKDEYTTINRDVSRLLYDRIGDLEHLQDEQRQEWEKVAGEEVGRALVALKAHG